MPLPVLLRQEDCDGVVVLSVSGGMDDAEADGLVTAAERVLDGHPRGVVLDLAEADELSDAARCRLSSLSHLPAGWPRAPFVLCPGTALPDAPSAMTAPNRGAALARVQDRAGRRRTRFVVPHDETGPAQARAAVTHDAFELGLDDLSDDVALLVSEMVTNAVRHAEPPVRLEVEVTDTEVVVAVCDGTASLPVMRAADDDAEGGRGMLLVDLLTADHGVRSQPPGKTVWARLLRPRSS